MIKHPEIVIDYINGNCPVQAEGTVDGVEFYFRSRGEIWSIGIGGDVTGDPDWEYIEPYGTWPDAGWITEEQARAFIEKAAGMWKRTRNASARQQNTEICAMDSDPSRTT